MRYVATIGTFDGLHRGHRMVLDTLEKVSRSRGYSTLVVTFSNHPLDVIAPQRAPKLIMEPDMKLNLLSRMADKVEMLEFTPELCSLSASQWLERLRDDYGVKAIVLGYDNTFGCDGRSLQHHDYKNLCRSLGIECYNAGVCPGVSSSEIRKAIGRGDFDAVSRMSGHFSLSGIVEEGRRLGHTIGFPTANILPDSDSPLIMPPAGVYATIAVLPDGSQLNAVTNVGHNPTVADHNPLSIETHILDYNGDLYGRPLLLLFCHRIRDEKKFDSIDELKRQIERDTQAAKEYFQDN